jgi:hypothetical protein
MDLLTVLAHELGHIIGREHDHDAMSSTLDAGVRLLPGSVTDHQTTRRPGHQTLFRSQRSAVRGPESGLWSAFADHSSSSGSPLTALDSPLSTGNSPSAFEMVNALFAGFEKSADVRSEIAPEESDEFTDPDEVAAGMWGDAFGLWSLRFRRE